MLTDQYDLRLLGIAILIAVLTAYAALDLAERVHATRGTYQFRWNVGGAIALGSGVWCMHYMGLLALHMRVPTASHVLISLVSLLGGITASFVALRVVSRDRITTGSIIAGGCSMGVPLVVMDYTGTAAMGTQAMAHYYLGIAFVAVCLATLVSIIVLLLIFHFREESRGLKRRFCSALLMGLVLPVMQCLWVTALIAVIRSIPNAITPDLSHPVGIITWPVLAMLAMTYLILGVALAASLIDRQMSKQHSLLDSERSTLRALIDTVPEFMYVKDLGGHFVIANNQLAKHLGATSWEEILGKTNCDLYPATNAKNILDEEREMIGSGVAIYNREETHLDEHGNTVFIVSTKIPLRDKGVITGFACVGRDISERRRNEEAARIAERKYQHMFDGALVGIFSLLPNGKLSSANPAMAEMMGYSSPGALLSSLTAPLRTMAVSALRNAELRAQLAEFGYVKSALMETFKQDGSTIWVSASCRAISHDGKITGYEGMFEDVSERLLMRMQLLQAQKLEAVGQLAAGIAHEINTPIQYIGDNLSFLQDAFLQLTSLLTQFSGLLSDAREDSITPALITQVDSALQSTDLEYLLHEVPSAIEQALAGVSSVATLVGAMKEFSHPGTKEKTPLDLNQAIQSTVTISRNEWKYVADLETDFDPLLPMISCLPGEINQVILNLIVNASHAISKRSEDEGGGKGKILVQTKHCSNGVEIRVGDSGCGIPVQIRARIFDPFFTTKEIGKGTGQGLAIARSVIVDKHAGTIEFETAEGQGTTFVIRLPLDIPNEDANRASL